MGLPGIAEQLARQWRLLRTVADRPCRLAACCVISTGCCGCGPPSEHAEHARCAVLKSLPTPYRRLFAASFPLPAWTWASVRRSLASPACLCLLPPSLGIGTAQPRSFHPGPAQRPDCPWCRGRLVPPSRLARRVRRVCRHNAMPLYSVELSRANRQFSSTKGNNTVLFSFVTVLCSNRVSQMTKTYDDIEAVTRLLEEVRSRPRMGR